MGVKSREKRERREAAGKKKVIDFMQGKPDIKKIPIEQVDPEELGKFVILCKDPASGADERIVTPRSLVKLEADLKATIEKYGPKFADQELRVIGYLPANQEGTEVVEMPVVEGKAADALEELTKRIAPPEAIDATLQRQAAMLFEVSRMKAVSIVYYTADAGIGGAVIVNPNNAVTNEEATQLFTAMHAQADEFKRNAEEKGFKIGDNQIIIPNAGAVQKFKNG